MTGRRNAEKQILTDESHSRLHEHEDNTANSIFDFPLLIADLYSLQSSTIATGNPQLAMLGVCYDARAQQQLNEDAFRPGNALVS